MPAFKSFTVESRKFCFCLPVRLGVFILSLLAMVGGSIVATIGWMQVAGLKDHPLETADEIALIIHSSIFSLLGFLGVFGFTGSLVRLRGMIIAFSVGVAIHLGLSIGSGVFTIYSIFRQNSKAAVERCIGTDTDEETKRGCQTGMAIVKGLIVAIYVLSWILELYAYFIVERYAEQLEDEEMAKLASIMPPQRVARPMSYGGYPSRFSYSAYGDPRGAYEERYPRREADLDRRPQSEYTFALPQQAYGVNRGKDASNLA